MHFVLVGRLGDRRLGFLCGLKGISKSFKDESQGKLE